MAGVVNASATLSMHVAGFGFGNVLPQYKWMCKTSGGEFNPSGYCLVGRIDASTGRLTTMMLPQAGFAANLVTVDLKSGAVLSDPQLCKQYTDCPWALAWAAGPKTA